MARCLAVAMSEAPGLSGRPDFGHCSSAATRASCARSSARPTSRTIRASPAMSLGDSILQPASMARCVSVAVTATDHNIFIAPAQAGTLRRIALLLGRRTRKLLYVLGAVFWPAHLANLGLSFPARPVFLVKLHEEDRRLDRLFPRLQLKLSKAADDLLSLGEGPVGHSHLPPKESDAGALHSGGEPPAPEHRSGFVRLFAKLRNGIHERLGWRALVLGVLDYHHESHF